MNPAPTNPASANPAGLVAPRSESKVGCLRVFIGLLAGVVSSLLLSGALVSTWTYCSDEAPGEYLAPDDGQALWLPLLLLRVLVYGAAFVAGDLLARRVCPLQRRWSRAAVALLGAFVLCAVLFAVDFSVNNGMDPGTYLRSRCPGGHLPWWPF
ncbi:hypothetical protein [Actinacidiphila rubida]|uniref:Uncharacterized protein n=1 Tax=Actinacidiphila rubida TaxID=310780 RepID=A0A1H8SKF0_9ACTN|nr:hypothetical protein [Actinacidiphila rubida]SEO79121.1 hypothetical protein SAMN05216267_104332 [Actinacidiphila rubida]